MKLNLLNNNDAARACRLLSLLMLLAVGLAGCKTSSHSGALSGESACLSSKVQLTVPHKDATLTVNGTMKLKKKECMQISFLMPILRTEVARMEVTPDEVLLVDRMGKRYVRATRKELKNVLPKILPIWKNCFMPLPSPMARRCLPARNSVYPLWKRERLNFPTSRISLLY